MIVIINVQQKLKIVIQINHVKDYLQNVYLHVKKLKENFLKLIYNV